MQVGDVLTLGGPVSGKELRIVAVVTEDAAAAPPPAGDDSEASSGQGARERGGGGDGDGGGGAPGDGAGVRDAAAADDSGESGQLAVWAGRRARAERAD